MRQTLTLRSPNSHPHTLTHTLTLTHTHAHAHTHTHTHSLTHTHTHTHTHTKNTRFSSVKLCLIEASESTCCSLLLRGTHSFFSVQIARQREELLRRQEEGASDAYRVREFF